MEKTIKNISKEDIITTIKYKATFEELQSVFELVEEIEKRSFSM